MSKEAAPGSGGTGCALRVLGVCGFALALIFKSCAHNADNIQRAATDFARTTTRGTPSAGDMAGVGAEIETQAARSGESAGGAAQSVEERFANAQSRAVQRLKQMPAGSAVHEGETISTEQLDRVPSVPDVEHTAAGRPHLISFAPENDDEFAHVYGSAPSALQSRQVKVFARVRGSLGSRPATPLTDHDALSRYFESLEEQVLVVVAHSTQAGRVLHFPDGLTLSLQEFHRSCAQARKTCLTLTCHSKDFGFSSEITAGEALILWKMSQRWVLGNPQRSVAEFTAYVRSARQELKARQTITLAWVASGGALAGGSATLYISDIEDSPGPKLKPRVSAADANRGVEIKRAK